MTRGGRRPAATVAVLALAVVLVGCASEGPPPTAATPTAVPLPTPVTTTFAINQTAWYAGLIVHVNSVTAVLRAGTGSVAADIRIENPGPDTATLEAPIRLTSSGQVIEPVRGTELPDVPAGGSVAVTVPFDVDDAFDLDVAAIRIGRTAYHQVVLPLVEGRLTLSTLAPRHFDLVGFAQAGQLLVSVHGADLRADLPDWGIELAPDVMALTITYDARYVGTFGGGFAFTPANIGLVLPDGRTIAAREDGHSAPAALIGRGKTVSALQSRFDVPAPGIGTYALVIRDGRATRTIPLAIGGS